MARKMPTKAHKGMGFDAASHSAAESAGVSEKRGDAIIAASAQKSSAGAKRKNPNLLKVSGVKKG
jgi:hypothetical protein